MSNDLVERAASAALDVRQSDDAVVLKLRGLVLELADALEAKDAELETGPDCSWILRVRPRDAGQPPFLLCANLGSAPLPLPPGELLFSTRPLPEPPRELPPGSTCLLRALGE